MHGLLSNLARNHEISAVTLINPDEDAALCERAMREYCREVILVQNPHNRSRMSKRLLQLRSTFSLHSFERHRGQVPQLQLALDRLMQRERFDIVNLEFPDLAHFNLRQSPPGVPSPRVVLDAHDVAYEIVRQVASRPGSLGRRLYAHVNWRKLKRDELDAFRSSDGVYACSAADQKRIKADLPNMRTAVIPNAADVEYYQPRTADPTSDGQTLVYFGMLSTYPNTDAVLFFLREIWPQIASARPKARFKIIGARPPAAVQAFAGPRVEVTGLVDDIRPHLASAAALVVPLRLGSGTRLKILEGMAMAKGIVSTRLGAEGIDAVQNEHLLVADTPVDFAAAVIRLLDEPELAIELGNAGRKLAVERYSWRAAADALEEFYAKILADAGHSG